MSRLSIALALVVVVLAVSTQATTCKDKCAGNDLFINQRMCVWNCENNERLPSDKQGRFGGETFDAEAYMTDANKAFEECKNTALHPTNRVNNYRCRCEQASQNQFRCVVRTPTANRKIVINRPFGAKMNINSFA